ncbi:MAG: hypothetical protein Q9216_001832 [Gyalolechia sp. 2 TL-2023]
MELVNTITDKPGWDRKILDDVIVAKWRAEIFNPKTPDDETTAVEAASRADDPTDSDVADGASDVSGSEFSGSQWSASHATPVVSSRMFEWAVAEVKYKAELWKQISCIEALDGVWKSDTIVGEDIRKGLEETVRPLEDISADDQDWHPGSNGQVLDLIHPSIYPLVYGQSKILEFQTCNADDCTSWIGNGITLRPPDLAAGLEGEWSKRFQWLPTEFDAQLGTEDVHVKSYINNLHPRHHPRLYSIIAQVVAKAIPLWDRVLSHVIAPPMDPRVSDWSNSDCGFGEGDGGKPRWPGSMSDRGDYHERLQAWKTSRQIIEPEPGEFKTKAERLKGIHRWHLRGCDRELSREEDREQHQAPDTKPYVSLRKDHGRLQIIVKLANVHLDPEKPEYPGGSWHIEGQANESICASALYYYSSHNITDSYLSFRQQTYTGGMLNYPQNEHRAAEQIYGIENEEPAIQNLGKVLTRESRLLCFPNVMQHRVSPFKLADPSQPGHRKLLALFLVDPHLKIISTENVPPQQHPWWRENVETAGIFHKLPLELAEHVLHGTDFPITLKDAREQRLELMAERKDFGRQNENALMDRTYSLCEH